MQTFDNKKQIDMFILWTYWKNKKVDIDIKLNKTIYWDKLISNYKSNLCYHLPLYIEKDFNHYKTKYNLTDEQLKENYYFLVDIKTNCYWHDVKTFLTLKF